MLQQDNQQRHCQQRLQAAIGQGRGNAPGTVMLVAGGLQQRPHQRIATDDGGGDALEFLRIERLLAEGLQEQATLHQCQAIFAQQLQDGGIQVPVRAHAALQLQQALAAQQGFLEFALSLQQARQRQQRIRIIRPDRQCLLKGSNSIRYAPLRMQGQSQVEMRLRMAGLERQRPALAGFGLFQAPHGAPGFAQVAVRLGEIRLQGQRLADRLHRLGVPAALVEQHAQQMQGIDRGRRNCQDLPVKRLGLR